MGVTPNRIQQMIADEIMAGTFKDCRWRYSVVVIHLVVLLVDGPRPLNVRTIAKGSGVSVRSAYRSIDELLRAKKIEVTPRKRCHRHRLSGEYKLCQLGTDGRGRSAA